MRASFRKWALVGAMLVAGLVALDESPAGADGPNHYSANICGGGGCLAYGDLGQLNLLKGQIWYHFLGGTTPAAIGLQESCWGQVLELQSWLTTYVSSNYKAAMWGAYTGSTAQFFCGGSAVTNYYGPAAYAVAPGSLVSDSWKFDRPGVQTPDPADEIRGYSCVLGSVFGFYTSCTAHMVNDFTYSFLQFEEYYEEEIVTRATGGNAHPVWWGGDLYVTESNIATAYPGFSYSANLEADRCFSSGAEQYRWTHRSKNAGNLNKFDWVFRSGPGRNCGADAVLYPADPPAQSIMWRTVIPPATPPPGMISTDHRIGGGRWV